MEKSMSHLSCGGFGPQEFFGNDFSEKVITWAQVIIFIG